ncbi:phosphoribosylformylglycinamidine synthase, partial [Patescibacteria group bacterium]|nr:phosphoribosylformylglycinamidine synthase [Patescibacteria group bacterium]
MMIRFYRRLLGQHAVLENCFYVDLVNALRPDEIERLKWLITEPQTVVTDETGIVDSKILEIGPRLSVETPFSSNAIAICRSMGIVVRRIETSVRHSLVGRKAEDIVEKNLDRMTQTVYSEVITTFGSGLQPDPVSSVFILEQGEQALREANTKLGLGMDDWDITYYTELFQRLGRNPTDVELFQVGNANSEHSRHWFFRGIQIIDGHEMPSSLFDVVQEPWKRGAGNSITAFRDNSGVIYGAEVLAFVPTKPGHPSPFRIVRTLQHITATAETHNHPTLIAPFPGAETGSGGRIRDNRAVGRGGLVHAGLAGYCVGNLHIPGVKIPGEVVGNDPSHRHASPLEILLRGSDGISDYGNKIGEPLLGGFTRSFGQTVNGARREFRKPVLYSAGFGRLNDTHVKKSDPETGMLIVRIGGTAYSIGV